MIDYNYLNSGEFIASVEKFKQTIRKELAANHNRVWDKVSPKAEIELCIDTALGLEIEYGFAGSPFGRCFAASTPKGICALGFIGNPKENTSEDYEDAEQAAVTGILKDWPGAVLRRNDALAARIVSVIFGRIPECKVPDNHVSEGIDIKGKAAPSYAGDEATSGFGQNGTVLKLHLRGTPFQAKVWNTLLKIPFGSVASYKQVAALTDNPRAVRAAASAIARNPVAYVIPCHRVIHSDGTTGQYRWHRDRKAAMLMWEKSHG